MSIAVGDQIGDYEVTGTLGVGGMGQVYQVRHTISHRVEALKVLAPGRPVTDEIVGRFVREIQLLASLHHPNITALHTAFRHEGELIMIMEFVEGLTLSAKLNASPMMLGTSLNYIQQVLAGLAYAHEHKIIHRDVKPSNIMIGNNDQVKLLDFGLAIPTLGPEFTRTGTILGSLHYMSPEQVLGEQIDARSDVYSVGVTLYQLVTGRLPFDGPSEYSIANGHLRSEPINPTSINSDLPARLSEIVLKSLAKSPSNRFQTAKEFLGALGTLRSGETTTLVISGHPDRVNNGHPEYVEGDFISRRPEKTIFDAGLLGTIVRDLAYHVGPIAKIVVSRAVKKALTLDDLYEMVAAEIGTEQKRKTFLATRGKYSASK
jgi:eukaryotic-like serine/threonine-protein kinase